MEKTDEDFDEEYLRLSEELEEVVNQRIKIVSQEKQLRAQIETLRRARIHSRNGETVPVSLAEPAPRDNKKEPIITDHAMVRFLERRYSFDFQQLKADLLTEAVKMACKMGAQSVKAHGGRWTIRGGVVTTFLSARHPSRKAASRRGVKAPRRQDFQTIS